MLSFNICLVVLVVGSQLKLTKFSSILLLTCSLFNPSL